MIVWGFQNFAHKCYISHRFAEVKIFHSTPTSNTSKQQLKNSLEKRRLEVTKCKIYRHALCFAIFRTKKSLNSEKAGKKMCVLNCFKNGNDKFTTSIFFGLWCKFHVNAIFIFEVSASFAYKVLHKIYKTTFLSFLSNISVAKFTLWPKLSESIAIQKRSFPIPMDNRNKFHRKKVP